MSNFIALQIQSIQGAGKIAGLTDISSEWSAFAVIGRTTVSVGTWYHAALVVDGNELFVYWNGILDGSRVISTNLGFSAAPEIGRQRVSWALQNFDGLIDEVRIYNRALSAEEIKALYDAANPT